MTDNADEGDAKTLAAIKDVLKKGGRELSKHEAVAFVSRPPTLLGANERAYKRALKRRKDLYRRLVKLPHQSKAAAAARWKESLQDKLRSLKPLNYADAIKRDPSLRAYTKSQLMPAISKAKKVRIAS